MNKKSANYIILFLILANIVLLYKTNPSKIEKYDSLNMENNYLIKEINKTIIDKELGSSLTYSTDKEFLNNIEEIMFANKINNYEVIFDDSNIESSNMDSKVFLDLTGDQYSLISLINELERLDKLSIISIELKSKEDNIEARIGIKIKSNFDNYFRAEKDLFNKSPFKQEKKDLKKLDGIRINSNEGKIKANLEKPKEIKASVNLSKIKETSIKEEKTEFKNLYKENKNSNKRETFNKGINTGKVKLKNIEFLENEYENMEEIDDGFYLYSFNTNKNKIKYIGDRIYISEEKGERVVIEFWINTTFDNLEVGIEKEYKDSKIENKKLYNKRKYDKGWNHVNFRIDTRDIESIRILFSLPPNIKRGSVLIDKIVIWEVDNYE